MFNLVLKTLRDKRFFMLGWSLGLAFLGYLMMAFYTSFNGGQVDQLMDSMPEAMRGLVGDLQDWRNIPGYVGSQVFDIRLPIFIGILAILLAVSVTVGEEDKGQLRTLTALPLSRRSIVLAKWLGLVGVCLVAATATILGVIVGLIQIQEEIDGAMLFRLGVFTWLQAVALATFVFALGLATGKRALTTSIAIIVTMGGFLLSTFAQAVDWLQDIEWLSIFHYFPAVDVAKGEVEWGNIAVYGAIAIIALVVALVAFARRDIRTS